MNFITEISLLHSMSYCFAMYDAWFVYSEHIWQSSLAANHPN